MLALKVDRQVSSLLIFEANTNTHLTVPQPTKFFEYGHCHSVITHLSRFSFTSFVKNVSLRFCYSLQ